MSIQENIQVVKDFFAAMGGGDRQRLLALCAEDFEWIIPGRIGRWLARTAGTRDWRTCFSRLPQNWKHPWSLPSL